MKVCLHGAHPLDCIVCFSGEVSRQGCPNFSSASGGGHGVHWWWGWVGRELGWGNCGGGAKIDGTVVGTTEDTVVTKGVTGGSGLVTGMLGWQPEGGNGVLCLGGEGSNAGLAVY